MRPNLPPIAPPAASSPGTGSAWLYSLLNALLLAVFGLVVAAVSGWVTLPGQSHWAMGVLLGLSTVATVVALSRHLPLQNVLLATCGIALLGGAAHALGARTGIPFGSFTFGVDCGPELFKTLPWSIPLLWVVALLSSRGVARLMLRPWRKTTTYGFRLIGLTALLTMLFDFALEPFASYASHYWRWTPMKLPVDWYGASPVNFISWGAVALLILAFITPALINKQPVKRQPPDFQPFGIWLGCLLVFAAGSARHGFWPAVGADVVIGLGASGLVIRGVWW